MATKITVRAAAIGAAGCLAVASAAQAGPLAVVNVGAPAVNCAFNTTNAPACQVVVEDAIGTFNVTGDSGVARLQSRNYPGKAPAPAAGDMAYIYRVDLTNVQGILAPICVAKLALDFGPVVKLPYDMPKAEGQRQLRRVRGNHRRAWHCRALIGKPGRQHHHLHVLETGLPGRHELFLRARIKNGEAHSRHREGLLQSRRRHGDDGRSSALRRAGIILGREKTMQICANCKKASTPASLLGRTL
jgi:hypothetical protein